MKLSTYSSAVMLFTVSLQILLALHMARKRILQEYPVFFCYTVFTVCHQVGGYLILKLVPSFTIYFYYFWMGNSISILLGFGVIRELFNSVLQRYEGILELSRLLFRWALVLLLVVSTLAALASPSQEAFPISVAVLTLERIVRIVQCGLILFLFLFAKTLGLSWRHHSFGIAFGFALFAAVSIVVYGVRMHLGSVAAPAVETLIPTSYMLASSIWAAYLFSPVPQPMQLSEAPSSELYRWNAAALELLRR